MAPPQVGGSAPRGAKPPYTAFGVVVPEKRLLTRELLAGFGSHFWNTPVGASEQLDALVTAAPGEPSPLPLTSQSGLSRTQFLVAAQAATVPCFPTYCKRHGGLVLDRVLFKGGGENWWTSVSGRMKVQNILSGLQDESPFEEAKNPGNYIMASETKATLGRTSIKVRAELDGEGIKRTGPLGPRTPLTPAASAVAQVRQKLPVAELRTELGINRKLLSGSTGVVGYARVPLAASVDLCTPAASASPLQFRVGMHGVTAQNGAPQGGLRSSLHAQGAVALQGERSLWARARPRGGGDDDTQPTARPGRRLSPSEYSAGPSGVAFDGPRAKTIGPHNPLRQSLSKLANTLRGGGQDGDGGGRRRKGSAGGRGTDAAASGRPLFEPSELQEVVLDSTQSIARLREDVSSITDWLQGDGNLARGLAGGTSERRACARVPHGPWSSFLPPSHFKLGGMVGLLVRTPMLQRGGGAGRRGGGGGRVNVTGTGGSHGGGAGGTLASAASGPLMRQASWLEARVRQSGAWLQDSLQRQDAVANPFASGGALLQLGGFQRNLLDFTRLLVKADLGLVSPRQYSRTGAPLQAAGHPAFALEGVGAWHALTVSACQQVLGPVRACADFRFAMESGTPLGNAQVGATRKQALGALASHVAGMRPSLLEAAYGLDVAVPNTSGLVRLVAWYTPARREGMLEVRMF